MKTIFRIAKLELSTLFYSPIAWFLAIIFLFQSALGYTGLLKSYVRLQDLGGGSLEYLTFLTSKIMGGDFGMFSIIVKKIYLYLPLLTMGLISRELSSGTIKLLYSSPVKVKQIVFGKFFAMMVYNLLLIGLMAILCGIAVFNIPAIDGGLVFSCLLGIFLLLCAYSAIGLFMSSLTSYQIVAAISTLVVFALLEYVGQLWQGVDFIRNLTYFLSISGRTNHMLYGLIDTKDLIYFVVITTLFLVFAIIKLQSDRETKPFLLLAGRYIATFVIALGIGYLSGIPRFIGYLDTTTTKTRTLTPNTQKVIDQLGDQPMEITFYANILDNNFRIGSPEQRNNDMDRWAGYTRFKPNIKLNYIYYYAPPTGSGSDFAKYYPGKTPDQIAKQRAEIYNMDFKKLKSKADIDRIIDLSGEQYRSTMQIRFRGKTTFLRLFNDQTVVPTEPEITAAFKRLTVPLPKIAFLQGEYERSIDKLGPRDYGAISNDITFRYALINQGFEVSSLALQDDDIPNDLTALVIGDPRAAFSPQVLAKLEKYIAEGGNLLIAGEGDKREVLAPLMTPLGVRMAEGMLLQSSKNNPLDMVVPLLTETAAGFSGELKKAHKDSIGVTMPGVTGLSYTNGGNFTIKPLLLTDEKTTWNKKGKVVIDSAAITYSAANGDDHGTVATALALTRTVNGKEQRIVVTGDADFMTTSAMMSRKANFFFNTQVFRWFTYGQFPIDTTRPESKDYRLDLSADGLSTLKIFLLGILPGLLIAFAAIFLIRRKRK